MDENFEKLYKLSTGNTENINKIEGIASEYDVEDKTGEIIKYGAFDKDVGKVIPIQVMHGGVTSTVGTATLSKQGKKLVVDGELFDNDMGKTIALAKSKGVQYNLSIGGKRIDYGFEKVNGKDVLVTTKGTISEVSITGENQQAHPSAIVTKNFEEEQMEKIDYKELALEIAKAMDLAEDGKKTNEEMKKMQEEIGSLKAEIEKTKGSDVKLEELTKVLEKMDKTINELSTPGNFGANGINKSLEAEMEAYEKAIHDVDLEGTAFTKALNTTGGAALIPQLLANEIIKDLKDSNVFYANAKIYRGTGKSLEIPVRDSWTNTVEGVAEGAGVVTKGTLTYTKLTIDAAVMQSEIELTDEMRQDTYFNVQAEVREAAVEDFDEKLSINIVSGVIGATQKFEGFAVNTTVTGAARGTSTSLKILPDDLLDMEMDLKKADRVGAKYYASKDAIRDMKKFKDTQGQYLWQAPLTVGAPSTFNGYPVEETDFMKNKTAGAWVAGDLPVLFANFGKFYAIYEKMGMETEMDRKASERVWNNITRMRAGGKVKKASCGKLLKIKA